jgi:hypothetical protein
LPIDSSQIGSAPYIRPPASDRYLLSNTIGEPATVLMCEGVTSRACTSDTRRYIVTSYSTIQTSLLETATRYVFFKKPVTVLASSPVAGTNTAHNSFGAPVKEKK